MNTRDKADKRIRQIDAVRNMLLDSGQRGCTSEELNRVAFRYSALIHTLRHRDGFDILTMPRSGTECARYVLVERVPVEQMSLAGV